MRHRPAFEASKKPIYVIRIWVAILLGVFIFSVNTVHAQSSFSCSAITLKPFENGNSDGLIGSSVAFQIINNNDEATTLMRVHLEWPTLLDYPNMYAVQFAMNNIPHWQGVDMADVNLTTNVTDTAIDPSIPPNFFNNTPEVNRLIPAYGSANWTGLFGNSTPLLAQYVTINHFYGTEFYLFNPRAPSTYCRIGLALPPPPTPPAPLRNYFMTHTPTLTWSAVSWTLGYQIEIDDDSAFKSPLRAEVASNLLVYTVESELPNHVYYWRVRAKKNIVDWGNWSAPETIVVSAP